VAETIAVEADLHTGSAGEVDERFYSMVRGYLARHAAPAPAIAAMQFVESLGRWNFAAAAELVDPLLAAGQAGPAWVPPRILLDGGVMAKLHQGDIDGAKTLRDALTHPAGRSPTDLRRLLLEAYIAHPPALAARR
jgi:hypothetical protein